MEPVLVSPVRETELTFLLSIGCLIRLTTELSFPPYIDLPLRSTHTPAHCPRTRPPMKRSSPIRNEMEFQQWLASLLQAERDRLRKKAAAPESLKHMNSKVAMETHNEGDTA